ncbi:EAL domain-containing protein [Klenkia terrae]|uniref:EAL domain-containing protein n=1 Tax=Klenkia terrae TaxID=1052259 RepID=UPI00361BB28E
MVGERQPGPVLHGRPGPGRHGARRPGHQRTGRGAPAPGDHRARPAACRRRCRPLRDLALEGVGVALDDFGTGYTSVAYLERYPISVLKLDRSVTGYDASVGLLRGLVALATGMGTTVLAEGIETDEQCARLATLGVDAGQGWLFGRPVPTSDLTTHRPLVTSLSER